MDSKQQQEQKEKEVAENLAKIFYSPNFYFP